MSFYKEIMSDDIAQLPYDQNKPTETEIQIMNALFKENHSNIEKLFHGLKDVALIGVLFFIISLPQINNQIQSFYPYTGTSPYIMSFAKACLFMILYFIIKNMYLVRK